MHTFSRQWVTTLVCPLPPFVKTYIDHLLGGIGEPLWGTTFQKCWWQFIQFRTAASGCTVCVLHDHSNFTYYYNNFIANNNYISWGKDTFSTSYKGDFFAYDLRSPFPNAERLVIINSKEAPNMHKLPLATHFFYLEVLVFSCFLKHKVALVLILIDQV